MCVYVCVSVCVKIGRVLVKRDEVTPGHPLCVGLVDTPVGQELRGPLHVYRVAVAVGVVGLGQVPGGGLYLVLSRVRVRFGLV